MTCLTHVQLYLLLFLIMYLLSCYMYTLILYLFSVTLSALLHYRVRVTLYVVAYYACSALHIFYCCRHMPICMFTSITSSLPCSCLSRHHYYVYVYHVTTIQSYLLCYNTGYDYRLDPMMTSQAVMILKEDMLLYFYCFIYAYYMVSLL